VNSADDQNLESGAKKERSPSGRKDILERPNENGGCTEMFGQSRFRFPEFGALKGASA
jgi:hypothetical protein